MCVSVGMCEIVNVCVSVCVYTHVFIIFDHGMNMYVSTVFCTSVCMRCTLYMYM